MISYSILTPNEETGCYVFKAKRLGAIAISTAASVLQHKPQSGIRILSYHAVGTRVDGDVNGIYNLKIDEFRMHCDLIERFSNQYAIPIVPFGTHSENGITITFDDGYADALSVVGPELNKRKIPFHVFVSPGKALSKDPRYLSPVELVELATISGATIGAHGYSHVPLTKLSPVDMVQELTKSKESLEQILQSPIHTMSYPFGLVNNAVRTATKKAGFTEVACSKWGFVLPDTDRLMQPRVDVWSGDSKRTYLQKLAGTWNWFSRLT